MSICDVSVVIPTYNRVLPLHRALSSIARQTVLPAEIIVIDDCSKPTILGEVSTIVSSFSGQSAITLLTNERRSGANYTRNRGIFAAMSSYVAFLDSDDLWLPEKLERQIAAIRIAETVNDRPILSATGRYRVDGHGEIIARQFGGHLLDSKKIRKSNFIGTLSSVVVDTGTARRIGGFDEKLPASQDWDFFIRLSEHVQYVGVADPLCVYVDDNGVRITQDYRKKLRGHVSIYRNHVRPLKGSSGEMGAELLRNIAEDCQELGKKRRAAHFYARALSRNAGNLRPLQLLFELFFKVLFCLFSPPTLKQRRYHRYRRALSRHLRDETNKATLAKDVRTIQQLMV